PLRSAHARDRWMLCPDGLSRLASLDTLAATLTGFEAPGQCADEPTEPAREGGGPHDVPGTAADAVDVDDRPRAAGAPATAPQIVGSAARSRHAPPAASGPAAKAAALTREEPEAPYEDEDFTEEEPPRRGPWPALVALLLLVALLGGVLWAGYAWSQRQFYVG